MRSTLCALLLACLALEGCEGPRPIERVDRPQAVVAGSHADAEAEGVATFRVTSIDGWPVGRTDEPSKTLGVDAHYPLDAGRKVRVEIEGLVRFRNPLRALTHSARQVDGSVEFVPADHAHYTVRGRLEAGVSTVWLEDESTHQVIGEPFKAVPKPVELRENTM